MICTSCGYESPLGMRFCGMCSAALSRACQSCGFANPAGFKFCGMCGVALGNETAPSIPDPPVPTPVNPLSVMPENTQLARGPVEIPLEGERRVATVLITDLTGSSTLLEQMGTEAWVTLMNRILRLLEAEVTRFGGHVDQFRGDGMLAFFGAQSAHEDDPERAVLAALSMQKRFTKYIEHNCKPECQSLRLRIGVSSGEIILTNLGDSQRHEETGMGMTVAMAARMEQSAEPGTVLVSESTYRLCKPQFDWQPLGEITVKGISQPIAIYRPLIPITSEYGGNGPYYAGYATSLVLRDHEFQQLRQTIESLHDGVGGITVVSGDRGMGKSLLVNEMYGYFVRQNALLTEAGEERMSRPALTWLRTHCRSYDRDMPHSAWLEMMRNWLEAGTEEPAEEARDRLRSRCEHLWGEQMGEYYPYLATFLNLPLEEDFKDRVKHLDAEGIRAQFFFVIRSWVEALVKQGPLILMFSDMHWADVSTIDFLKYCLPVCDDLPVLWLFTLRPDRTSPAWGLRYSFETDFPHRLTVIQLNPLTEDQSADFINHQIGAHTLPEETQALVIRYAVGNPYYIEELLHSLAMQKVLVQDEYTGEWKATRVVTSLDLPESLHSLLLAHIDGLSAEEQVVLQIAAIIGPDFWYNVLQGLLGVQTPLKAHLAALQRAQMIRERGLVPELGMLYSFKTTLIRDAAYESLLTEQREAYHLQVAAYFENHFDPELLAQHYSLLAYQYRSAGRPQQELEYVIRSAQQAQGMYANYEALKLYTRALELLDHLADSSDSEDERQGIYKTRFEVLQGRREVLAITGDQAAAEKDSYEMLELARYTDSAHRLIDALLSQPQVTAWKNKDECNAGIPIAQEALELARQSGDKLREMRSLQVIARQYMYIRNPQWQSIGEEALLLARELNDRQAEARILISLGTAYSWSDQPQRGTEYLALALPLCQEMDDKTSEVNLLHQMGLQLERQGDYYRVLKEYQEKRLRISRKIGYRAGEVSALISCGQIQSIYLGDHEGGIAWLEEARRSTQTQYDELQAVLRIIMIQIAQGQYQTALQKLSGVSILNTEEMFHNIHAGALLVSAIVHNTFSDNETHLRNVLEKTAELDEMLLTNSLISRQYAIASASQASAAHYSLTALQANETDRREHTQAALEASQRALDIYSTFGYLQIIECTSEEVYYRHSRALAANGKREEAMQALQRAHEQMMCKYKLIPEDSPFRRTYLENIPLHRDIRAAYQPHKEHRSK
jgi:class 3 adenylate cyclase/predicted ATPase/tetratricopeptide (TPR) repeat protein